MALPTPLLFIIPFKKSELDRRILSPRYCNSHCDRHVLPQPYALLQAFPVLLLYLYMRLVKHLKCTLNYYAQTELCNSALSITAAGLDSASVLTPL